MHMRYLLIGLGVAAAACGSNPGPATTSESSSVTYQSAIRPLIEANCLGCHIEGGTGPFRLDSLAAVTDVRDLVVGAVKSRIMPPWPASKDCHDLRDVRALDDTQVALFESWKSAGFPDGDEKEYRPPAKIIGPQLGEPTQVLTVKAGYVPNPAITDEYRCFLIDHVFDQDTYVTAMDIRPGVVSQVHHVQVHKFSTTQLSAVQALDDAAAGEGYPCGGISGVSTVNMFSWRPGSQPVTWEPGDAALMEAGSAIILQVHYNNQFLPPGQSPLPDQSGVAFWTLPAGELPERIVVRTGQFGPVGPTTSSPTGMIPAGEAHVVGEASAPLSRLSSVNGRFLAGEIIGMTPHMHTLGTRLSSTLTRTNGSESCMIDVPNWDFEWQFDYSYATPTTYGANDTLSVRCEYDNSPAHQPMLNGERIQPRNVTWGEGSLAEMCLNYVWFRYDRDAFVAARQQ